MSYLGEGYEEEISDLRAEVERLRAEVEDYKTMPCEECLTYAPGPELAHLIAEKNSYMNRTFAALPVVDAARALLPYLDGCEGTGEYKLCHDVSEAVGAVCDAVRALDGGE